MFKKLYKGLISFFEKAAKDGAGAYASDTTLFIIVSFFPFLMCLLTLLQFLPFSQNELMDVVRNFVPSQVADIIGGLVNELYSSTSLLLSITIVMTLWTASRGILGIYRGLNKIYETSETRTYLKLRLRVMVFTLIFIAMLLMLLGLYVFGGLIKGWLTREFPILMTNKYTDLVVNLRSVIGIVILMIFFLLMYCFIPNRRPALIHEVPGAVFASVGWVLFSYFYSFYINNLSNMTATYGSLTAIVLCIVWLHACMNIFFLGAEINMWFNMRKEAKKGRPELSEPGNIQDTALPQPALPESGDVLDTALPQPALPESGDVLDTVLPLPESKLQETSKDTHSVTSVTEDDYLLNDDAGDTPVNPDIAVAPEILRDASTKSPDEHQLS